jgi:hypothetical protein
MEKKRETRIDNATVFGKKTGEERLPGFYGFSCQKLGYAKCFWPRDADNADATAPRRGRNGGYRVVIKGAAVG